MHQYNDLNLKQTYMSLHKSMSSMIQPKKNINSEIALINESVATELGIDNKFLQSKKGIDLLTGSTDEFGPLFAQAYAGHQFGHLSMLGDGRALMLGEYTKPDGSYVDLQLKGSGLTPYSRRGDGKATLYSLLREYLISEAIHSLNIPTTRILSIVKTNELITRITPKQSGVACRVSSSHIRVGTFEYANSKNDINLLKELADYTIDRHFEELNNNKDKY